MSMPRIAAAILILGLSASACSSERSSELPLDGDVVAALDGLVADPTVLAADHLPALEQSEDERVAWVLVDVLRFHQGQPHGPEVARALTGLTGVDFEPYETSWVRYADALMADDVPPPPGYLEWKRSMFVGVHERWAPFFDPDAPLDWRHVTWGGVLRDAIQPLDDPPVIAATEADWGEDEVVFGIEVDGRARAYPRRILETHEVVNDTIGSRPLAFTYCTLCGAPIGYFADARDVEQPLLIGTTGLLNRSNKLMYDRNTESMFDQFRGRAVSSALLDQEVELERATTDVTTWGDWRRAHPDTTVLPNEIGGRTYSDEPPQVGVDGQPIFPVGDVDARLDPLTVVVGAIDEDGQPIAFPSEEARRELDRGGEVRGAGVELHLEAGALVARSSGGSRLTGNEAFWFAWSQFHPDTLLWTADRDAQSDQ